MSRQLRHLIFSSIIPLASFWSYSTELGDDYSAANLAWGGVVTVILNVVLYVLCESGMERFSPAWGITISLGMGFVMIGLTLSSGMTGRTTGLLYAWAEYMWHFGLFGFLSFILMPKNTNPTNDHSSNAQHQ